MAVVGLIVSFVAARSTYAQGATTVADQVIVVPVPPNPHFARHVIGADGASAGAAGERLVYSNTLGKYAAALGAGRLVADDISINAPNGCKLRRLEFPVVGKVDPAGIGGPYTVEFALYDNCPGAVPVASRPALIIPGTAGQAVFADDAPRLISFVVPQGVDIPIPTNAWLGVKFNRNNAGPLMGAPALVGFSSDSFDFPGFPCNANFGGFPGQPHGSFKAELYVDAGCPEAFLGYRANKPSGSVFNPGGNVTLADDIRLGVDECRMVAYEVGVKGPGAYTFDLRTACEGGVFDGSQRQFSVASGSNSRMLRSEFDPPVPLPRDFWFATTVNNTTGGAIVAGVPPAIGDTKDSFGIPGPGGCSIVDVPGTGLHAALHFSVTCAGSPPIGACCDMVFVDEAGEAVCREVLQRHCPWPPRGSDLEPKWVLGATCDSDPFPFPCGAAACCRPDDVCENLTLRECNAVEPLDGFRAWQKGKYCGLGEQTCENAACVYGQGDCLTEHPGPGCRDEGCCTNICADDPFCCEVSWDRMCVEATTTTCASNFEHASCDTALTVEADSLTAFTNPGYLSYVISRTFCCSSNGANSVAYGQRWFKFTATDTSAMVSLCGSDPVADSLFNVYAVGDPTDDPAECARLVAIACGDDAVECGGVPHGQICMKGLVPGRPYYVVVAPKFDHRGFLQLELQSPCFERPLWNPSDCNANGVPDGCENGGGTTADCNSNDILDECEVLDGTSFDCDGNGRLDVCVGVWRELAPSVPTNHGSFGYSVGLDDPVIVVGSGYGEFRPSQGYPLEEYWRGNRGWEYLQTLYVPVAPVFVAIDGGWIVTGSDRDPQTYLFPTDCYRCAPIILQGPAIEPCQRFGVPIAIHEDLIALGKGFCQEGISSTPEQVVLFRRVDDRWLEEARIEPPESHGRGIFGASVAISGDRLVVGAPVLSGSGSGTSMAHVYRRLVSGWVHEAVLHPEGLDEPAAFGRSAAMDGDVVVIGATLANAAWVFRRRGLNWEEEAKLQNPQSGGPERFGWSVAIARNTILVGDTSFTGVDAHYGGVTLFRRIAQQWIMAENLDRGTANQRDSFGQSLDTDGSVAVVGAPATGTREFEGSGSAFIFQLPPEDCNENAIPDLCDVGGLPSTDCNFNRIPDECEELTPDDSDFDDDVDLIDLAGLQPCFTGPGPATVPPCCRMFDIHPDSDVDLRDFAGFQNAFGGSGP
jgi:hypothetical protein